MTDTTASALLSGQGGAATAATTTGTTDPNATTTAATGTTNVADGTTNAPNGVAWLNGADEVTVGYVQNKGWAEPKQLLDSYMNLEKLLGADKAGNAVVLPKPEATKQELDAFYNRLGRPSEPAGYKIEVPKDLGDPEFAKVAAGKFHELGLTQRQGEELAKWWNDSAINASQTQAAQSAQAFQADEISLKAEWGAAYNQNLVKAQTAVRGLGISSENIDKLSSALGHKATMEFFEKIGSKMGEAEFVSGKTEGFSNVMTPGQAKAEIQSLVKDKDFTAKLLTKNAEAVNRWTKLHQFAYPEANS